VRGNGIRSARQARSGGRRVAWTTASTLALTAVLATSATGLLWLGSRQFVSYDGFWHIFIARLDAWPDFLREVADNAHPPLYYLLLGVAIDTLGLSFLSYRAISIAATLGSTLLLARIVARLTANPWFGVVGAAAFGLSFNAVDVGLEVRAYALGRVSRAGRILGVSRLARHASGPTAQEDPRAVRRGACDRGRHPLLGVLRAGRGTRHAVPAGRGAPPLAAPAVRGVPTASPSPRS
jgi:hypothetical protein